ncbi:MAG: hypothetical protein HY322_01835 [Betaproteobacteria bacterium]|nr:hypothetical protein [Betaproteobacteria bacterium]
MVHRRQVLVSASLFVFGTIAGAVVGAVFGFQSGENSIVQNWVNTNTRDGAAVVSVLRQIRTGQTAEGLENLETHLNRLLFGLIPSVLKTHKLDEAISDKKINPPAISPG